MAHLNWGILGAAKFAREHMGPAIHLAKGARLAALATSSPKKASAFQEFAPDITVHATYEALLEDPSIDAVYIPLPNHLHVEWALKGMAAGKHVLVEKPATLKAQEFDQLIAARDASKVLCAEAYMIVHHPQWQRAKALIGDGALGELKHITGAFSFDNRADVGNIRNRAETGGGGLRDIGVYIFGSARFATGLEPKMVSARLRMEDGYDVFADVQAQFGQATYSAYCSTRMHPHQEMVFHGTKGVLRVQTPFNAGVFDQARLELMQPDLGTRLERFPRANQYVLQVEAFGHSVRTGADYGCPLEFSRGTQEMIDWVLDHGVTLER
ncbi:MAG: Gfo/Idh/MocA family oxidoreductase [Pseudomonadota bacterium]